MCTKWRSFCSQRLPYMGNYLPVIKTVRHQKVIPWTSASVHDISITTSGQWSQHNVRRRYTPLTRLSLPLKTLVVLFVVLILIVETVIIVGLLVLVKVIVVLYIVVVVVVIATVAVETAWGVVCHKVSRRDTPLTKLSLPLKTLVRPDAG